MSGFQQKDGEGVLFKNEEKEAETHADYKGSLLLNGQEYWLNAWVNTAKSNGKKYIKVTTSPKQAKHIKGAVQKVAPQRAAPQPSNDLPFDDDIPF